MNNNFSNNWVLLVQNFTRVFTKAWWWQLWSNIHLADNEAPARPRAGMPGHDNIWKIRPLFELQRKEFQEKFYIGLRGRDDGEREGEESSETVPAHETHQERQQGVGAWLFLLWLHV